VPFANWRVGAIALGQLGSIRLDLMPAIPAPHDDPGAGRSGTAERCGWTAVGFHGQFSRGPITNGNEGAMAETNEDWSAAPKDGSVLNVRFRDGTRARARWNALNAGRWEVLRRSGEWVGMEYERHGDPDVWWE
jgi:hypothetical protein